MSPLYVWSKVCMAPFHVRSKVCIAPIHVRSKVCQIVPHMDGNDADFAPHMEGSHADFAPHMEGSHADFAPHLEWRRSFRDQKIAKIAISANLKKNLNHLYLGSLYHQCDIFLRKKIFWGRIPLILHFILICCWCQMLFKSLFYEYCVIKPNYRTF